MKDFCPHVFLLACLLYDLDKLKQFSMNGTRRESREENVLQFHPDNSEGSENFLSSLTHTVEG